MIKSILAAIALMVAFSAPLQAQHVDFSLQSPADGKSIKLSELRGKYVALHFLLKTECPFCLKHTQNYAVKSASLPNVVQLFVKPDSVEEIKAWAARLDSAPDFPHVTVYRDPDAKLADEFKIPGGYQFHGQSVHFPATVLLDPMGREVFRYVGKNNTDRYSFEKLAAKVAELAASSKTRTEP